MTPSVRIAPLDPDLDRRAFASGVEALDRYFRERVTQDVRRRVASCFVALDREGGVSATGRPEREHRSAEHEGLSWRATGRPEREHRSAEHEGTSVIGYYTLSAASVLLTDLPAAVASKLPRYPTVPAVRLGRLAVARTRHGQGFGAALLADALARSLASEIAAFALLVDAKDDSASAFYRHHGFVPFADATTTLFLPLATARAAWR